ncbi:hypothetical protein KBT16_29740 [Nostoc sp. CCCryo 231-06]|nr:hypothetical protein [Nostoc sp. CCCryo 231-06]
MIALATQNRAYQTDFLLVHISRDSSQRLIKIPKLLPSDRRRRIDLKYG